MLWGMRMSILTTSTRSRPSEPREFPELEITREKGGSIDGWKVEDFVIKGYNPHKSVPMKMSV
jgi:thymidylate synthase